MAAQSTDLARDETVRRRDPRAATPVQPLAKLSEPELIADIAAGDESALAELYDRFAPAAYGIALRILRDRGLAEDAVQEAFLSAWRSAASFDSNRASARSWILMLTHRRAVDLVQRNQRQRTHDSQQPHEQLGPSAAETTELDAERLTVQAALASLPEKQRKVLDLAYYGGYSQQQIATSLAIPVGTVKSQTFDALIRLRLFLAPTTKRPT